MSSEKKVFMIGGIRGAGKSTVCDLLVKNYSDISRFDKSCYFAKSKQEQMEITIMQYFQEFVKEFASSCQQILIIDRFFQNCSHLDDINDVLGMYELHINGFIVITVTTQTAYHRTKERDMNSLKKPINHSDELKLLDEIKSSRSFIPFGFSEVCGNPKPLMVTKSVYNIINSGIQPSSQSQQLWRPQPSSQSQQLWRPQPSWRPQQVDTKKDFWKKVFAINLDKFQGYPVLIQRLMDPLTRAMDQHAFAKDPSICRHMMEVHKEWKDPCCCKTNPDDFEHVHREWMFEVISHAVRYAHICSNKVLQNAFGVCIQDDMQQYEDPGRNYLDGKSAHMRFNNCVNSTPEETFFALQSEMKEYICLHLKMIVVHNRQISKAIPSFAPIVDSLTEELFLLRLFNIV
jgi:adenylate kinase family enzyme